MPARSLLFTLKSILLPLLCKFSITCTLGLTLGLAFPSLITSSAQESGKVFELRTYTATPGNLANLQARFRDHTLRIFEKHGMTNIGYWSPIESELSENTLIYLLAHDSRVAADASWRAFGQDPEWKEVSDASNVNGPILEKVERIWLHATDFSPLN